MDNPFADLVIGNVCHIQTCKIDGSFQAVETRAMKDKIEQEEHLQRVTEAEILSERLWTPDERTGSCIEDNPSHKKEKTDSNQTDQNIDLSISKDQLKIEQENDESLSNVKKYALSQTEHQIKGCENSENKTKIRNSLSFVHF